MPGFDDILAEMEELRRQISVFERSALALAADIAWRARVRADGASPYPTREKAQLDEAKIATAVSILDGDETTARLACLCQFSNGDEGRRVH